MAAVATFVLGAAALLLLVPCLVLLVECCLAILPLRARGQGARPTRPSVAVLVPAHDEEVVIGGTVRSLLGELAAADRLLVVADNCSDSTASVARAAGATVIERSEPRLRGKGHALDFGVSYLSGEPPEVLVVVDADCRLGPGSLDRLARLAAVAGRPVQARNVVALPPGGDLFDAVSAFAFLVKNVVRPSGLARLGLPCPLMGTGMAFPWSVIQMVSLGSSALAEDLKLGLDLTLAGRPPLLCLDAGVSSPLPVRRHARETQRRRWEHGHLSTLASMGPALLWRAARRLDASLIAVALDLCVPPLSLLALGGSILLALAGVAAILGASWAPALLAAAAMAFVGLSTIISWLGFGTREFRPTTLLAIPFYALGKVPLYIGFVSRRQKRWVRTERDTDPGAGRRAAGAAPAAVSMDAARSGGGSQQRNRDSAGG
jgi:cellulose synthase/poly-beta-1,6-N-acetylglucosamine synthase-like glycosyltransferase